MENWTSPGSDQLYGFWFTYLTKLHLIKAKQFNKVFCKEDINDRLILGHMYLIQKDPAKGMTPRNYRLITCLPTIFKLQV